MEKTDDLGWELTQANGLSLCIKAAGPSVLQENEISATCAQAPTQLVWAVNSGYIRPHSQTSGFFFCTPQFLHRIGSEMDLQSIMAQFFHQIGFKLNK